MSEEKNDPKSIAQSILNEEYQSKPQPEQAQPAQSKPQPTPMPAAPTLVDVPLEALGEKSATEPKPVQQPEKKDDDPDEIKNANVKTREAFARLRTQLAQAQEELERRQQSAAQPTPEQQAAPEQILQSKQRIDELTKKLEDAYNQIGKFSLESDPRFQAKYSRQQTAIMSQIGDVFKEWEVKDDVIKDLLRMTPRKRVEQINEIAPDLLSIVAPLFSQYDHVERMKQDELANHRQVKEQIEIEQQKAQVTADQTGRIALFSQAVSKVMQDGHFLLKPIKGQDEWNKNVEVLQKKIQYLFQQNDPVAQAEHMVLGVTAPVYLALFKRERTARLAAEEKMKNIIGIKPSLDGRQSEPAAQKESANARDIVGSILREEIN